MQKNTMFQAIFQNFSAHFLLYFCHRSSGLKKVFLHKLLSSSPTHEARRYSKSRESAGFAGVPTGAPPGDESEDTLAKPADSLDLLYWSGSEVGEDGPHLPLPKHKHHDLQNHPISKRSRARLPSGAVVLVGGCL